MLGTIDNYELIKLVGEGANGKVFLCRDTNDGATYAIKVMQPRNPRMNEYFAAMIEKEVGTLKRLSHPGTVRLIADNANAMYVNAEGRSKPVMYLVMEFCPHGELIEVLFYTGQPFEEPMARYIFKSLLESLGAVHQEGLVHRDIKPENILFDAEWNLKLADFGFATLAAGREGSGLCETNLGTPGYKAPEIYAGTAYNGVQTDLFALGVILFILKNHGPPFTEANPSNSYYKRFYMQSAGFWKSFASRWPAGFFSEEFMDIINKMLALEAANRLDMAQLLDHPWMKGPTATREEYLAEVQSRFQTVVVERERQLQEARAAREGMDPTVAAVNRGGNEYKSGHIELPTKMKPYVPSDVRTQFFSTSLPEEIYTALVGHFQTVECCTVTSSPSQYFKFKAEIAKPAGTLCIKVNITDAGDVRSVLFTKTTGIVMDLQTIYRDVLAKHSFLPDGIAPSN